MKKCWLIIKLIIYYIIGFIAFSIIAYITQQIAVSVMMQSLINPLQDMYNIANIIQCYFIYYFITYTILYYAILYMVRRYDKHIVKILNEKL